MKRIATAIAFSVLMCTYSYSSAGSFYENCIELSMKEQMRGMKEADRPSVKAGVERDCKLLVKECEERPDGQMCKIFKKKFEQN